METKFQGKIDSPTNNQQIETGFLLVKGWAFDSSGKDLKIEVHVDDVLITIAHQGLPRYDMFQQFNNEESYESGFIARIPVSKLAPGPHKLNVYVKEFSDSPFDEVSFIRFKTKGKKLVVPPLAAGQIGQYRKAGREFLEHSKTLVNLKPNEKILEVGCGMGRFAHAFSKLIDKNGSYDAIDPMPNVIEYCKDNISKRYPNFNFQLIDVFNEEYSQGGKFSASNYKFPFQDNHFDFVFLHSVFTHLVPNDMINYLKEISRVLKTNGRCLITYILYSDERLRLIKSQNYRFPFEHKYDNYRLMDPDKPENAIAYDEKFIVDLYKKNNLIIQDPIHYSDFNKNGNRKRQDFITAKKIRD